MSHPSSVVRFSQFPDGCRRDGSESKGRSGLLGTNWVEWATLSVITPLVATETRVTKASCPQIHGGAVGPGTVPLGSHLDQEDKALDLRE